MNLPDTWAAADAAGETTTETGSTSADVSASTSDGLPDTPLYAQYRALRDACPGALLLFRLGDFYELFGEDARVAAPRLGLLLTSRDGETPMCGVPVVALEETLARLVSLGFRVAVAEQMEMPGPGVKLVRRAIVRLASPGTYVPPEGAEVVAGEGQRARRVAALAGAGEDPPEIGLAVCDLVTGAFAACRYAGRDALADALAAVASLAPAEVLWDPELGLPPQDGTLTVAGPWFGLWDPPAQAEAERLGAQAQAVGEGGSRAARAVLRYVTAMAGDAAGTLEPLAVLRPDGQGWGVRNDGILHMDAATRRHLELTHALSSKGGPTLLAVLDRTRTAMGARLLRAWLEAPLTSVPDIATRQEAVAQLVGDVALRAALREGLASIADVDRLVVRTSTDAVSPRELVRLGRSLRQVRAVADLLAAAPSGPLRGFVADLNVPDDLDARILTVLTDEPPLSAREGGLLRDGVDPDVDRLRALLTGGRSALAELEERERTATGLRSLRLGYHRKLGYYLEVPRGRGGEGPVPEHYRLVQGMAGAARYTTEELRRYTADLAEAQLRLGEMEYARFTALRDEVKGYSAALRAVARALAEVDVRQALAETAQRLGWRRPEIVAGRGLSLRASRHPVVEAALPPGAFVPNDVELGTRADLYVVTGPNMGGKSTYLRQVALCTILAQMGSFVPAERARLAPVDRIFARIGAGDDLAGGRSTFFVEMEETAAILRDATRRSLVVIDELGRGTATFDGLALAWAVIEHLATRVHSLTLVATHYHELIGLAERLEGAGNLCVQAVEAGGEVRFLRRVMPGGADRSYGIAVARLAGVAPQVLRRAEEILADLEAGQAPHLAPERRPRPAQVQLLPAPHAPWVQEVLALDLGRTSPLDALVFLTGLQERLRREERRL